MPHTYTHSNTGQHLVQAADMCAGPAKTPSARKELGAAGYSSTISIHIYISLSLPSIVHSGRLLLISSLAASVGPIQLGLGSQQNQLEMAKTLP